MQKRYFSEIVDADDGSGDGILTIPPEIIEELKWTPGMQLTMSVEEDANGANVIILKSKTL
jgi:hypothetical protein